MPEIIISIRLMLTHLFSTLASLRWEEFVSLMLSSGRLTAFYTVIIFILGMIIIEIIKKPEVVHEGNLSEASRSSDRGNPTKGVAPKASGGYILIRDIIHWLGSRSY
mgnify:CR=1 FL=1